MLKIPFGEFPQKVKEKKAVPKNSEQPLSYFLKNLMIYLNAPLIIC